MPKVEVAEEVTLTKAETLAGTEVAERQWKEGPRWQRNLKRR